MPFALLTVGILFLIVGVRNTDDEFLELLKSDFTGSGNFLYWVVSIIVIGSLGYIPRLRPISNGFLVLVMIVLFLSNEGFFNKFTDQVFNRPIPAKT